MVFQILETFADELSGKAGHDRDGWSEMRSGSFIVYIASRSVGCLDRCPARIEVCVGDAGRSFLHMGPSNISTLLLWEVEDCTNNCRSANKKYSCLADERFRPHAKNLFEAFDCLQGSKCFLDVHE